MPLQHTPSAQPSLRRLSGLPRDLASRTGQHGGRAGARQLLLQPALATERDNVPRLGTISKEQQQLTVQPTRLQQQTEELLAIDVECAHFRVAGQQRIAHFAAEVCIVDGRGNTVLHSHCNPLTPEMADWEFVGGVPVAEWEAAPSLRKVRKEVAALIKGRVLVGHNLPHDLATLGLSHPKDLRRDTMRFRQLQSKRGTGKRLQALSQEKLGREIQAAGKRHDPREDALAALDLYLQHVHFDPGSMSYEDLVEHHTADILRRAAEGSTSEGRSRGEEAGGAWDAMQ